MTEEEYYVEFLRRAVKKYGMVAAAEKIGIDRKSIYRVLTEGKSVSVAIGATITRYMRSHKFAVSLGLGIKALKPVVKTVKKVKAELVKTAMPIVAMPTTSVSIELENIIARRDTLQMEIEPLQRTITEFNEMISALVPLRIREIVLANPLRVVAQEIRSLM